MYSALLHLRLLHGGIGFSSKILRWIFWNETASGVGQNADGVSENLQAPQPTGSDAVNDSLPSTFSSVNVLAHAVHISPDVHP